MKKKSFISLNDGQITLAPGQKVIPAKEFSTALDANDLLEAAQKKAEETLEIAEEDAKEIKKRAHDQGYQEGLKSLNAHILALDAELKQIREDVHQKILPLALKAAKKIIGEELKLHPDRIVDIVMTALKPVTQHKKIIIYANRSDIAALEEAKPKLKELFEHLQSFSLQERSDIEPGGCMIETEAGIINAQLENQWRALEMAFASFMKK